ncbi:glycoside hydrolase family 3 protein [Paraglaciecola arctica]|uniref:glycoside hydrolase family 3 protein n=1 Tax=Paraglaciecola arctica TaxID=1128911 RepID=UPI001C07D399|nr:glycoside hydrolase family 3 protein [Paraglaciecola arctica]MBU3001741.1 glycoside hydrolase family 3 protein [Paraglaciecola arctica]
MGNFSRKHGWILGLVFLTVSCATVKPLDPKLQQLVAQKLMIDIRYFCDELAEGKHCTNAVTKLPKELSDLIADTGVGGVILFAENLQDIPQMVALNKDLQNAAKAQGHPQLLIAVDQEGGRVMRLPKHLGTGFSGNMAIGATADKHGTFFATQSGAIIGKELAALGMNVNFAPTVDVNVNPENPVINVRSFGESAQQVAELGLAQVNAMQAQGVIAAMKHFPGHGDTSVDSHTGLPRVEHDIETITSVDLKPFQHAINHGAPGMIMTAHIQYPQLDATEFKAKDGSSTILPATMSRKILTEQLRQKMGFKGVIVTDALNMAGIAQYFDQTEAVIQTFDAGADIALMPMPIRSPKDFKKLKRLIRDVSYTIQSGRLKQNEMSQSVARIQQLRSDFDIQKLIPDDVTKASELAANVLGNKEHRDIEQQLANAAIVNIKNDSVFPLSDEIKRIHMNMPDKAKCMALTLALKSRRPDLSISCASMASATNMSQINNSESADLVILADISPRQSMAELGGMDDITRWQQRPSQENQSQRLLSLTQQAKASDKKTLFISLRTPYNVSEYAPYSDAILATFAYNLHPNSYVDDYGRYITEYGGASFNAIADILTGKLLPTGKLPVTIH